MTEMTLTEAVVITSWISDKDFEGLINVANNIRANVEDLILVLITESQMKPESMSWCPPTCSGAKPKYPYINAVGLNQIIGKTAVANGWLDKKNDFQAWAKDFAKKKFSEQLPYVTQYFQNNGWYKAGKAYESATRIYLANAASGLIFMPLTDTGTVYSGADASANAARSTIGGLKAGLNATKAHDPIWQASLIRLKNLGTNQMRAFLGLPAGEAL